jgi:type IV pilus assembly protein PilB
MELKPRLGQILVESGVLTLVELERALEVQREEQAPLGDVLVSLGLVADEGPILQALQEHYRVPAVSLEGIELPEELISLLPAPLALRHGMVPVKREGNLLTVAMMDPGDVVAIDDAAFHTKCRIEPVIASFAALSRLSKRHYGSSQLDSVVRGVTDHLPDADASDRDVQALESLSQQAPVVRLVNSLLIQGIQMRASDVHVEPDERGLIVRYRIDGVLQTATMMPDSAIRPVTARLKVMANLDIANRHTPQDGTVRSQLAGKLYTMRVSTLPTSYGEKVVLRVLDRSTGVQDMARLGLPPAVREQFTELLSSPQGILLVTGPTGSGKTTTLYAGIVHLRSGAINIVTLEDPIEYQIAGVTQSHAGPSARMSFAQGLRTLLRQDPDVILVGEIRDPETAQLAARAAMTGHLVLSTVHTNDAAGTLARLIDMGVEAYLVSSTVIGIMAQRLVRSLCPQCKELGEVPEADLRRVGFTEKERAETKLYQPRGCNYCGSTGYYGRLGVYELMTVNEPLRELISTNPPAETIRRVAGASGMVSLREAARALVLQGETSVAEVLRVTEDRRQQTAGLCLHCDLPVEEGHAFCPSCGQEIQSKCGACGQYADPAWEYCAFCGERQGAEAVG